MLFTKQNTDAYQTTLKENVKNCHVLGLATPQSATPAPTESDDAEVTF